MTTNWILSRWARAVGMLALGAAVRMPAQSPPPALPAAGEAAVARWIATFSGSRRGDYETALVRSLPWATMIAAKLEAAGLPNALIFLPLIESTYSPWAESSAGARGLWQLMPATARSLGLEVSAELDERRDPFRSTDAAIAHLRDLYRTHHDWLLALSEYNAGGKKVRAGMLRVPRGPTPSSHFWSITPFLPRETRDYVPQLLAAYHIGKTPHAYGIRVPLRPSYPAMARVSVPPRTPLRLVAAAWGMTEDQVWAWNPALMQRETPSRWYALVLPAALAVERQQWIVTQMQGDPGTDAQRSTRASASSHGQTPAPMP